jgi:hypothetical protein
MEPEDSLSCSQEPSTGPYPKPDQSSPYHAILSLSAILILFTHLCPGLLSGPFPSGFPTNILYAFLLFPASYMPRPSHPHCLYLSNYTWQSVQVMKLLIMQLSPPSCHFIPLRPKYSHQHPVFVSQYQESKFRSLREPQEKL